MEIIFIKDHPAGIKEGRKLERVATDWALKMIKEGYAKELAQDVEKKEEKHPVKTKELKTTNKTK